jgi:hypothetical protein
VAPPPPSDLCASVRRLLADGRAWPAAAIEAELTGLWGRGAPSVEVLSAVLAADLRLWRLPDGRWVDLPAVVDGRTSTVRPTSAAHQTGVLDVDVDLVVPVLRYAGWDRIPVTRAGRHGLAESAVSPAGRRVLVVPSWLVPPVGDTSAVLAVRVGPEGLVLSCEMPDEVADVRLRRRMDRQLRRHLPLTPTPRHGAQVPRGWSVADVELAEMAADPTVRTTATSPLSELIGDVRPADRVRRA